MQTIEIPAPPMFTYCKFAGRVDLDRVDPNKIDVRDFAFHLSRLHRFNGASDIVVAAHLLCAEELSRRRGHGLRRRLHHLLHDGAETYVSDMARAMKRQLPLFQTVERAWETAIFVKFGATDPDGYAEIDNLLLANEITHQFPEAKNAFTIERRNDPDVQALFDDILRLDREGVRAAYADCLRNLLSEINAWPK